MRVKVEITLETGTHNCFSAEIGKAVHAESAAGLTSVNLCHHTHGSKSVLQPKEKRNKKLPSNIYI